MTIEDAVRVSSRDSGIVYSGRDFYCPETSQCNLPEWYSAC